MKASKGSGGTHCGRNLSKDFDCAVQVSGTRLKVHKYGGDYCVTKKDFKDYKERKANVANAWIERCPPLMARGSLALSISNSSERWYGVAVQEAEGQGR